MANQKPSQPTDHPDHHLWRNGRLWWVAFTVHLPNWQKERIRLSLGTDDIEEARRRRDQILSEYPRATGCELSLRLDPPRGRRDREITGLGAKSAERGSPQREMWAGTPAVAC
jgi:hypothetical protein